MRRVARRWARVAEVRVRRWSRAVAAIFLAAVVLPPTVHLSTGSAQSAVRAGALVLLWGGYGLALLLGSGGWAAQRRSGSAALWIQKPVRPALLYLDRLAPRLMVTGLGILTLTALSMGAAAIVEGGTGVATVRTIGGGVLVTGLVLVCMMHGISGLGLPREELIALVGFAALAALEWKAYDSPGSFGVLLPLAGAVGVPVEALGQAGRLVAGAAVPDPVGAVVRTGLYALGWIAVGTVGIALTRHPLRPRNGD